MKPLLFFWFFFFFFVIFVSLVSVSKSTQISCDVVDWSYRACLSDPVCRYRFSMDENIDDYETFTYLLGWYASLYKLREYLDTYLCEQEHVQHLWITMMRHMNRCKENEYYEYGYGCTCRNGKQCKEESVKDVQFEISHNRLLGYGLVVTIVIMYFVLLHRIRDVYRIIHSLGATNTINSSISSSSYVPDQHRLESWNVTPQMDDSA